jgi:hypothetical protein
MDAAAKHMHKQPPATPPQGGGGQGDVGVGGGGKGSFFTSLLWGRGGTVLDIRQTVFTLEDAIEVHAFAPLEALPCV